MSRLPYPLFCTLLGLALGWIPMFLHGPIPEKWSFAYLGPGDLGTRAYVTMNEQVLIGAYYVARLLIGVAVGVTAWPRRWFLRGPFCGAFVMLPLGIVALANPLCGST